MAASTVAHNDTHDHDGRLRHMGPAIPEEYFPEYATVEAPVTPLYSTELIMGSAVILVSMCALGLAVTALAYHNDGMNVSIGYAGIAAAVTVVVFLVGLGMCFMGFKKYARPEDHH